MIIKLREIKLYHEIVKQKVNTCVFLNLQTALPWKWMAIESLKNREFSFNSDVWAYGVCLYEIFTLGQSPYPGIGWSLNFITQLENGLRMEQPVFCTKSM